MSEKKKTKIVQTELPAAEVDVGVAAVRRFYTTLGKGFEQLRETISAARGRGVYVYAINLKWPKSGSPGFFLLIKAYTEEGPRVAYHSDYQLLGALISLGERFRAGDVEWVNDEYPPEGWADEMAFMHTQELNRE